MSDQADSERTRSCTRLLYIAIKKMPNITTTARTIQAMPFLLKRNQWDVSSKVSKFQGFKVALAFPGRCCVEMADGYRQGIGGVGGLGNLIEIQKARHHLLDLMFFGAAVSDHRRLDGEGRVLSDFESGGSGGQHGDSAHLAELQGRLHVGSVENVFDRDPVGAVLSNEFLQSN